MNEYDNLKQPFSNLNNHIFTYNIHFYIYSYNGKPEFTTAITPFLLTFPINNCA